MAYFYDASKKVMRKGATRAKLSTFTLEHICKQFIFRFLHTTFEHDISTRLQIPGHQHEQPTRMGPAMATREEAHRQHPTPGEALPQSGLQTKRASQRHPQPRSEPLHPQRAAPHNIKRQVHTRNASTSEAPPTFSQHQCSTRLISLQQQQSGHVHRSSMRQHSIKNSRRPNPHAGPEARKVNPLKTRFPFQNWQIQQQRIQGQLRADHAPNHARPDARPVYIKHNKQQSQSAKNRYHQQTPTNNDEHKQNRTQHTPALPPCL